MKHISEIIENINNKITMEIKEYNHREVTFTDEVYTDDESDIFVQVLRRRTSTGNNYIQLKVEDRIIDFDQKDIYEKVARTACELLSKAVNHPCELPTDKPTTTRNEYRRI